MLPDLLAAGVGSRLGGRPKALLHCGGVPLIVRQLIALSGAGVDELVVVLGHHAEAIEAPVRGFPITLVHNPPPGVTATHAPLGLAAAAAWLFTTATGRLHPSAAPHGGTSGKGP